MLPDSIRPMLLSSSLTPEGVDRLATGLRAELKEPKVKQFSRVRSPSFYPLFGNPTHTLDIRSLCIHGLSRNESTPLRP